MAFYAPRNIGPADQVLFDAEGNAVGIQAAGSSSQPVLGFNPTKHAAIDSLVSGDGVLSRDSAGRPIVMEAPDGAQMQYGVTYTGNKVSGVAGSVQPWMWMDANGATQFPQQTNIRGSCIALGNVIHCISRSDRKYYRYENGTWSAALSSAIDASSAIFHLFFIDSRGYLFAAWGEGSSQRLYRSTDNGVTWAAVLTPTELPDANDYCGSMAEADNGYLYATGYNGTGAAGVAVNKIWRSTDGGATWVNITPNLAFQYLRHVHSVVWDKHRRCLWVCGGDGAPYALQGSADYGDTWAAWTGTIQATAIACDAENVYYTGDTAGDRSVYRGKGATMAAILASTPREVFDIADVSGTNGSEFAWWGKVTNGIVHFHYGRGAKAFVAASADQGLSWRDILDTQVASTTLWGFEPVFPSDYAPGWDGTYYSFSNTTRYAIRWAPYPSGMRWLVSPSAGSDVFGNGITTPTASIPETGIKPQAVVALVDNYDRHAWLSAPGLVLDSAGYRLGAAQTGTLAVDEGFESTSSLTTTTANSGTVSQTSTANPHTSPRHARCTTAAVASSLATVTKTAAVPATSGTTVWLSGDCYVTAASLSASLILLNCVGGTIIYAEATSAGAGLMVQQASNSYFYRQVLDDYTALPLNAWVRIKLRVYLHATRGEVEVWQDGRRVLMVQGINTINTFAGELRWGAGINQVLTVDWDDVKASAGFDPEKPAGYVLAGRGQYLIRERDRTLA